MEQYLCLILWCTIGTLINILVARREEDLYIPDILILTLFSVFWPLVLVCSLCHFFEDKIIIKKNVL